MNKAFLGFFIATIAMAHLSAARAVDSTTTTTTGTTITTTTTSPVTAKSETAYLQQIEPKYLSFAGSHDNLASITNGLRNGGTITLQDGTTTTGGTSSSLISFSSPTKPMGYGNITHTLDYASRELTAAGITSPTADQLKTALMGGTVVNASGQSTTLQGVLSLRSQGMGWGQIAHSLGISPSPYSKYGMAGKSGLTSATNTTTSGSGITTAGTPSHTLQDHASKSAKSGIVSASGSASINHGNNVRSGIVTASGTGTGLVAAGGNSQHAIMLASGNASNGSITSANASSGHGNAFGKGKN